jgi:integrase
VKFPKRLRHNGKGKVLATIYGKQPGRPYYRLYWRARDASGKPRSHMVDFPTYGAAKKKGDAIVAELAKGTRAVQLTPGQVNDTVASLERLQAFFQQTGRNVSLLRVVSEWCDSSAKLHSKGNDRTVPEAIDGYLGNVASVTRYDLGQAVKDFIKAEEPRTKSTNGERAQLSSKYAYNRGIMLRRFADTFPGHAVCDLAKEHLDTFITSKTISEFSAKSRNHHRAAIKQLLQWCVRKDYLPVTHRLFEADSMRPEHANHSEVHFYTPIELRTLLEASEGPMQAMIAIGGLAGLRTAELMRLTWEDVWRVRGHIEITAGKAKTRQRRLVEVCPALASWLRPFRKFTNGKVCPLTAASAEVIWQQQFAKLCENAGVTRKANGLRHSYCSYHFALHGNENLTAKEAGNSPTMIHSHYKGLATTAEARKWFAVKPATTANVIPLLKTATT